MKDNTCLLNWDGDFIQFFLKNLQDWSDLPAAAAEYMDTYYKDCGIGDILFNIFCQNSVTPSKIFTDRATKYLQKEENGLPVDYTDCLHLSLLYKSYVEYGFDPAGFFIDYCKKIGIRPWISLRMNDNHYRDQDTGWIRSDFFYEALEKGWLLGKKYRSSYRNYNYAVPEVRQKMLAYLEEQLNAYDVYGIELDFMREPRCVPYFDDPDCHEAMTEFMREVRAVCGRCEKKWGHPLKIAVRLPRDPETCRKAGYHAEAWAQKGYVDAVCPAGHWICNDTDMPVKAWADLLHPYGVEVWAGMEMNLPHNICICEETAKAHTAQYAAQGSDRTHIYNLYHPYLSYITDLGCWYKTPSVEEIQKVWRVSGDVEKCRKGVRRHVLTEEAPGFQDIYPRWMPLPVKIGEGISFPVPTGAIDARDRLTLFVGIENTCPKDISVRVNGKVCAYCDFGADSNLCIHNPTVKPHTIAAYRLALEDADPLYQTVTVTGDPDGIITYIELKIES